MTHPSAHHAPTHLSGIPSPRSHHGSLVAVLFTVALVSLLLFALHPIARELSFLMVFSIILSVAACSVLLPGSLFFTLALANLVAVYSCFFVIILDSHFRTIDLVWQWIGYISPLLAFLAGTVLRRRQIRLIIHSRTAPNPSTYAHALLMLLPLIGIAIMAMVFASSRHSPEPLRDAFLLAMGSASILIGIASRDMAVFLLVTGLLFESFFHRMTELIAPIFAFFTFYSFVILISGALYAGIDAATHMSHFKIMGASRIITFPEALYFSLATLATVGYGDIVPASNIMRMLAAIEVLCGVVLLLFGFNEILTHAREVRSTHDETTKE